MQYFTILAILFAPLFQLVVPQSIDPSTVDDATKRQYKQSNRSSRSNS